MGDLFNSSLRFNDDTYRNVVKVAQWDAFSDISDDSDDLMSLAEEFEAETEERLTGTNDTLELDFHYSTAIAYPFEQDPFFKSRFSDGTFPVWYGSLELMTTVHETAYHAIKFDSTIIGLNEEITRYRSVYRVFCSTILLNLIDKKDHYPDLVSEDYGFCQKVGLNAQKAGQTGLLSVSARCNGSNAVIFKPEILSNPRLQEKLTYRFDPSDGAFDAHRENGESILHVPVKNNPSFR